MDNFSRTAKGTYDSSYNMLTDMGCKAETPMEDLTLTEPQKTVYNLSLGIPSFPEGKDRLKGTAKDEGDSCRVEISEDGGCKWERSCKGDGGGENGPNAQSLSVYTTHLTTPPPPLLFPSSAARYDCPPNRFFFFFLPSAFPRTCEEWTTRRELFRQP